MEKNWEFAQKNWLSVLKIEYMYRKLIKCAKNWVSGESMIKGNLKKFTKNWESSI